MSRYIAADLLLEKLEKLRDGSNDQMFKIGMNTAMQIVKYTPAADVEKVKHGKWVDTGSGQRCSVCREIQYGYDNYRYRCSCCGAKNV